MPIIDNFSSKTTAKKFKKTSYRPWTILENTDATQVISDAPTENMPPNAVNVDISESPHFLPPFQNVDLEIEGQSVNVHGTLTERSTNNQGTNSKHLENSSRNAYETFSDQISKQEASIYQIKKEINSGNWSLDECVSRLSKLNGLQKNLLLYIGTRAMSNNSLSSGPLSARELRELLRTTAESVKTSAQRLFYKGFISKNQGKSGAGGFVIYNITENMKKAIIEEIQKIQFSPRLVNNQETNQLTEHSSISSSNNNNNTNTIKTLSDENLLTDEWLKINLQPLEEIGFNSHHLAQLKKMGGFSGEQIQESINAFAFDLQVNGKAEKLKGPPLNYFMGILRNGAPYIPAENYESPEVRALKQYVERKRREKQQKEDLEKEAFVMAFEDWEEKLTEEDVINIIPEPRYREPGSTFRESFLQKHFRETEWVNIQKNITNAASKA